MFDFHAVNELAPWFFPLCAFVFGACIGSFLNVVIYRVPKGESIVRPGSHCGCGAPIAWYDNIPILSWFILRGRARCCGRSYSCRYAFVELLTALLFLACWLLFPPAKALVGMVFLSLLVAATFIDLDHMIIPDAFTIGGGVLGLLFSLLVPALHGQQGDFFAVDSLRSVTTGLQGMLIGSGLVLWIALIAETLLRKEAMGFGDVTLMAVVGAALGPWRSLLTVFVGAALAAVIFLLVVIPVVRLRARGAAPAGSVTTADGDDGGGELPQVPFGVFLAPAAVVTLLWGDTLIAWYLARFATL